MLTPEREKEIRQQLKDRHFGWPQELLAEIDRLREEASLQTKSNSEVQDKIWEQVRHQSEQRLEVIKERDQLKEKLAVATNAMAAQHFNWSHDDGECSSECAKICRALSKIRGEK